MNFWCGYIVYNLSDFLKVSKISCIWSSLSSISRVSTESYLGKLGLLIFFPEKNAKFRSICFQILCYDEVDDSLNVFENTGAEKAILATFVEKKIGKQVPNDCLVQSFLFGKNYEKSFVSFQP